MKPVVKSIYVPLVLLLLPFAGVEAAERTLITTEDISEFQSTSATSMVNQLLFGAPSSTYNPAYTYLTFDENGKIQIREVQAYVRNNAGGPRTFRAGYSFRRYDANGNSLGGGSVSAACNVSSVPNGFEGWITFPCSTFVNFNADGVTAFMGLSISVGQAALTTGASRVHGSGSDDYPGGSCTTTSGADCQTVKDMALRITGSWRTTADPPAEPEPSCVENCNSSILFIPGMKGTELYEGNLQRWLPGVLNFDGGRLVMTQDGESVNTITIGSPLREARFLSVKGLELYGTFLDFLGFLQSEKVFSEWKAFPYDWRYDPYEVATSEQVLQDGSTANLAETVRALAEGSRTGKITIIAHSNGGLVAKALTDILGEEASDFIDRIVMVGTPQLGTPSAIGAMLHGLDQALPVDSAPLAMSKATARAVSENMPGAYGLLPLAGYFSAIAEPVVSFDVSEKTLAFRDAYGDSIDSPEELRSFVLGIGDGRAEPDIQDTLTPAVLNETLLDAAIDIRHSLETWQAPPGVEVIQVVGWGLDTVKILAYREECGSSFMACILDPQPQFTSEGDRTVVYASANAYTGAPTYYFNIRAFNAAHGTSWSHTNILAASAVHDLLSDIIAGSPASAPFITTAKPTETDENKRLRVSVHSPVTLGVRDPQGRFTGIVPNPDPSSDVPVVIEEIPNSYYLEFGEGKYIGFDAGDDYTLVMQGTGEGAFTLAIEEVVADTTVGSVSFSDVPVSLLTLAEMQIRDVSERSDLLIDHDGDGAVDEHVPPGQYAPAEESQEPEPAISLETLLTQLRGKIQDLAVKDALKKNLLKKIDTLEKKIEKKKQQNAKLLDKLQQKVAKQGAKGKIDAASVDEMTELLDAAEAQAETGSLDPALLEELRDAIMRMDAKQNIKNNLLKRIDRLEQKRALLRTLANMSTQITRRTEKGKILDADAEEMLDVLAEIEKII